MKILKMNSVVTLLFATLLLTSCSKVDFEGSDSLVTVTRSLANFSRVNVQTDLDVNIIQGDTQEVEIFVNDNLQNQLKTEVSNNTLNIFLEKGSYKDATFVLNITMPSLSSIQLNDRTRANVNFTTDQLEALVNDASELTLSGSSNVLVAEVKDAGILNGFSFTTEILNTVLRDASELRITCNESLNGTVYQASKLYYKGSPSIQAETKEDGEIINSN